MARQNIRPRARAVAFHLTLAIVLFGAAALAGEWRVTGSGPAAAKAEKAKPLVVGAATPTTLLYPGGSASVALEVANPNPWPVTVRSIVGAGAITASAAGCDPAAVTFTDQDGSWVIPKKQGTADGTLGVVLPDAAAMAVDAADACQDATFTIPVRVSTDPLVSYVAVGVSGAIATSGDGTTWTARTPVTGAALWGVAYGGRRWVAVGDSGTVLTSDDGIAWTARASGTTAVLNRVGYNGGTWVAVGASSTILSSPDGVTWTARSAGGVNGTFKGLDWDGARWLAIAAWGLPGEYRFAPVTSANGAVWTAGTAVAGVANDAAWSGTNWVVVGSPTGSGPAAYRSSDGATWTSGSGPAELGQLTTVAGNGSRLLATTTSWRIATSTDAGATWVELPAPPGSTVDVAWDGGQWLAPSTTAGAVYTSPDGVAWTARPVAGSPRLLAVDSR